MYSVVHGTRNKKKTSPTFSSENENFLKLSWLQHQSTEGIQLVIHKDFFTKFQKFVKIRSVNVAFHYNYIGVNHLHSLSMETCNLAFRDILANSDNKLELGYPDLLYWTL